MAKFERFVASEHGALVDSDVDGGGGADDTRVLQAILDRAEDDCGVHLVIDGVARTTGLDVRSNTVIEGAYRGCGLFLSDGSERSILRNAHRSRDAMVDCHITLRQLALGGNRDGQVEGWQGGSLPGDLGWDLSGKPNLEFDRSWKSPIQFLGVRDVRIEQLDIRAASSFSLWLANVSNVEVRDLVIDVGYGPYPATGSREEQVAFLDATPPTLDGIHINGPADQIMIDGAVIRTRDDAISLCANDWATTDITQDNLSGPFAGQGPITDVVVQNVHLDSASHGVRLYSADQPIDRVHVNHITGSVEMRGVLVSHFMSEAPGVFGRISLHDIRLEAAPSLTIREWRPEVRDFLDANDMFDEEGDSALLVVNAAVDELRFTNVEARGFDRRPLILVGPDAVVGRFEGEIATWSSTVVAHSFVVAETAHFGEAMLRVRALEAPVQ